MPKPEACGIDAKANGSPPGGYSVFEHVHHSELRRAKDDGIMTAAQLDTIVHPNEYFKRSYLLKNMDGRSKQKLEGDIKMEG